MASIKQKAPLNVPLVVAGKEVFITVVPNTHAQTLMVSFNTDQKLPDLHSEQPIFACSSRDLLECFED